MLVAGLVLLAARPASAQATLPWREAGLTEREAAAHLLRRFTYGPRPGDVERVLEMGLDNWLERQLQGDSPGPRLEVELARLTRASLDADEILDLHPPYEEIVAEAIEAGAVHLEDYEGRRGQAGKQRAIMALAEFSKEQGYDDRRMVLTEVRTQRLLRALYSDSQLVERLTDFWFNHFNVATSNLQHQAQVFSYERVAIRTHVLGRFRDLLGAIAKHPAMLLYLDNAYSRAEPGVETTFGLAMDRFGSFSPTGNAALRDRLARALDWRPPGMTTRRKTVRQGLNENYARELLELHTLGVDGGYNQRDVIEVARAFTGWTLFVRKKSSLRLKEILEAAAEKTDLGFVVDGDFLFRADYHDAGPKTILGVPFPAGRGLEDGEEVLDLLAGHPSTSRHLARKLAVRFVSDHPPAALITRLARAWDFSDGNLRQVMRTLAESPELWREGLEPSKLKSPFELTVSALRALDAEVSETESLINWFSEAGQPLYAYAAPTGFPDREETWLSTGAILNRINFTQSLARNAVHGVSIDVLGLVGRPAVTEIGSVAAAIRALLPVVLTERRIGEHLRELALADGDASGDTKASDGGGDSEARNGGAARPARAQRDLRQAEIMCEYALAILLGSPEFQRR